MGNIPLKITLCWLGRMIGIIIFTIYICKLFINFEQHQRDLSQKCLLKNRTEFQLDRHIFLLDRYSFRDGSVTDLHGLHKFYIYNVTNVYIFNNEMFYDPMKVVKEHKYFMTRQRNRFSTAKEIGPFTFRTIQKKNNLKFHQDMISFNMKLSYEFLESESIYSMNKTLLVFNNELAIITPILSEIYHEIFIIAQKTNRTELYSIPEFHTILDIFYSNLLVNRTVRRILYGPEPNQYPELNLILIRQLESIIQVKLVENSKDLIDSARSGLPSTIADEATLQILFLFRKIVSFVPFINLEALFDLLKKTYDHENGHKNLKYMNTLVGVLNNFQREQNFLIKTGQIYNSRMFPLVLKWNNLTNYDYTQGWCQFDIRQYETTIIVEPLAQMYYFIPQLCGSISMKYEESKNIDGTFKVDRFVVTNPMGYSSTVAPSSINKCYCQYYPQYKEFLCRKYYYLNLDHCFGAAKVSITHPKEDYWFESIKWNLEYSSTGEWNRSYVEIDPITGLIVNQLDHFTMAISFRFNTINLNKSNGQDPDMFVPFIRIYHQQNLDYESMYRIWIFTHILNVLTFIGFLTTIVFLFGSILFECYYTYCLFIQQQIWKVYTRINPMVDLMTYLYICRKCNITCTINSDEDEDEETEMEEIEMGAFM